MSKAAYAELEAKWAEIKDLENAASILGWDQEVMMPGGGAPARAHTLATLSGVIHDRTTNPVLVKLVQRLHRARKSLSPRQRRGLELAHSKVMKATRIPSELARKLSMQESRGLETWRKARQQRSFKLFADELSKMVDLKREQARLTGRGGPAYDALLDDFEPGMTMAVLDPLLDALKGVTVPLVQQVIDSKVKVDLKPFVGRFDVEAQRGFARTVAVAMGIDLGRGRMDLSTHPFCGGIGPDDVRMTSRYDARDQRGGLFGVIHESGHGLYEQGLTAARGRLPLGGAISMAVHESQSRLWENNVARSRSFWKHWAPKFKQAHPQLKGVTVEQIWRAANAIRPSFIRVEADELTYNLHIILRYELERDLVEGRLEVKDLPAAWNDTMASMLGVRPKHDADGVLQDIHWAMGLFGYFPTYSLGNLYAAQFMESARKALRGLEKRFEKGDFATLRGWLAENIHRHDRIYTAEQLVKRVTGKPLGVEAFARHIRSKVNEIYA